MKLNKTVLAFAASVVIVSGCSSTDEKDGSLMDEAKNTANDASINQYSDSSSLSGEEFGNNRQSAIGLGPEFSDPLNPLSKRVIYFMYNSSQVQQDFVSVVAAHAQYLLANPERRVVLEGHADERGSPEYNIALGEQRAKSIHRMMKLHGVSDKQLDVVSYGEEKPESYGMNEASWQLNRRVEIVY